MNDPSGDAAAADARADAADAAAAPATPSGDDGVPRIDGDDLDAELSLLEHRMERLVDLCTRLDLENRSLREQQRTLVEERARLIEKNDTARSKVEQMIVRLRSLEAGQ